MLTPKQKRSGKKKENVPQKRNGEEKHHHAVHQFEDRVAEQGNTQNNNWKFLRKMRNEKRRSFKLRLKAAENQRETQ